MRFAAVGLMLILLLQANAQQARTGTMCVASRADDPFRGQLIPHNGNVDSHGLRVKIDKRPAEPWPQRRSLKIDDLDLSERHLLTILDIGGKPVESIWFRFSSYNSPDLCMSYDEYEGVQLGEATRHTPWCKCK